MSITIRYEVEVGRRDPLGRRAGECAVRERTFPSDAAMESWVARQEQRTTAGLARFVGVIAYSTDPAGPDYDTRDREGL